MFTFFKTLDSVSKKAADFLMGVGVPNVTIEKFSQKQEGVEELESRIIAVDDLPVWEIYKKGGKILQRGIRINEKNNFDAYAHFIHIRAQTRLEDLAQKDRIEEDDSMFSLF